MKLFFAYCTFFFHKNFTSIYNFLYLCNYKRVYLNFTMYKCFNQLSKKQFVLKDLQFITAVYDNVK